MGGFTPQIPQAIFVIQQANRVLSDSSHVLNSEYVMMNSVRRYRVPLCKHNHYKY